MSCWLQLAICLTWLHSIMLLKGKKHNLFLLVCFFVLANSMWIIYTLFHLLFTSLPWVFFSLEAILAVFLPLLNQHMIENRVHRILNLVTDCGVCCRINIYLFWVYLDFWNLFILLTYKISITYLFIFLLNTELWRDWLQGLYLGHAILKLSDILWQFSSSQLILLSCHCQKMQI